MGIQSIDEDIGLRYELMRAMDRESLTPEEIKDMVKILKQSPDPGVTAMDGMVEILPVQPELSVNDIREV
jgi:hypothetical protein